MSGLVTKSLNCRSQLDSWPHVKSLNIITDRPSQRYRDQEQATELGPDTAGMARDGGDTDPGANRDTTDHEDRKLGDIGKDEPDPKADEGVGDVKADGGGEVKPDLVENRGATGSRVNAGTNTERLDSEGSEEGLDLAEDLADHEHNMIASALIRKGKR